jgi:hypothetical protein
MYIYRFSRKNSNGWRRKRIVYPTKFIFKGLTVIMYHLIKLSDPETEYTDYLVTKNLQQTLDYLSQLQNSRSSNYGNSITNYLIERKKKFYDLTKESVFEHESLEVVNTFLFNLKNNPSIIDDAVKEAKEKVKAELVKKIIQEEEVSPSLDEVELKVVEEEVSTPPKKAKKAKKVVSTEEEIVEAPIVVEEEIITPSLD